jgi:hypothetical protein
MAHDRLDGNSLPLTDDATVQELREIVCSSAVTSALKCAADTFFSFELRAALRIFAEGSHSNREIIDHLWSILDHPDLNKALGISTTPA